MNAFANHCEINALNVYFSDAHKCFIFQVMYEEGEYFAKYNKIKFLETSAVTGENVQVSVLNYLSWA